MIIYISNYTTSAVSIDKLVIYPGKYFPVEEDWYTDHIVKVKTHGLKATITKPTDLVEQVKPSESNLSVNPEDYLMVPIRKDLYSQTIKRLLEELRNTPESIVLKVHQMNESDFNDRV